MSRKMTGIVKTFDGKSGKGLITPSDGRIDVQLHVSALNLRDAEEITTGLRVEFCRIMVCVALQLPMFTFHELY